MLILDIFISTDFMSTQQLNIFPVILPLINVYNTTNVLTGLCSLDVS